MNSSFLTNIKNFINKYFINSLIKKFFTIFIIFITTVFIIFFLYAKLITYPYLLKAEQQKIDTISQFLSDDIHTILDFEAYDNLVSIQKKAIKIKNIEAIVIDTKKIYSEDKNNNKLNLSIDIQKDYKKIVLIEENNNKYFVKQAPIIINNEEIGYFKIFYSAKDYYKELDNYNKFTIIVFIVISILLLITMSIIKITLSPMTKLSNELKNIDFSKKIDINLPDIKSKDERSEIISAIKIMFIKLNEYIKVLNDVNQSLEQKVIKEVNNNRAKDRVMFQQSRLAAMGEMIGNIAHQWRQPLAVISGIIQNFELRYEMGLLNDEYVKKEAQRAKKVAHTMSQTIDDFRDFFKPNKNKEAFNVLESINNSIFLLEGTLKVNNIKYNILSQSENLVSYGFSTEFAQVCVNLISNSKDEFKKIDIENKLIEISIKEKNQNIEVFFCDNAGGIDDKIIDKVFEPYFSTKEQGEWTGLGLYMSKQIIEKNMNGKIEVYNKTALEHRGACFKITIPLYEGVNENK